MFPSSPAKQLLQSVRGPDQWGQPTLGFVLLCLAVCLSARPSYGALKSTLFTILRNRAAAIERAGQMGSWPLEVAGTGGQVAKIHMLCF